MDVKSGKANLFIEAQQATSPEAKITEEKKTATPLAPIVAVIGEKKAPVGNRTSVKAESLLSASLRQASLSKKLDTKRSDAFTEQVVNNAAKGILEAANLNNEAEDIKARANAIAAELTAAAAAVSSIPNVGPILSALLLALAAKILAEAKIVAEALEGSQNKSTAAVEQRATPGWAALKKDHDD